MSDPSVAAPLNPQYIYRAEVTRVIDGDTVEALVDCGFRISQRVRVRLMNYDAPELYRGSDAEREQGALWRDALIELFAASPDVIMRTEKDRTSFNRYVAEMWIEQTGESVKDTLLGMMNG